MEFGFGVSDGLGHGPTNGSVGARVAYQHREIEYPDFQPWNQYADPYMCM